MQEIAITGCRLSPQQKRLWLWQHVEQQPYHAQCVVLLKGSLDTQVLKTALTKVTERHEILRTNFPRVPGMSLPLQVIAEDGSLSINEYALEESGIDELLQKARQDTDTQPQILLIELSIDEHALVLSLPAMYSDATGLRNLVAKISSYYDSILRGEPLADEPIQYADLSEWQIELLEAENAEAGKEYWRKQASAGRQALKLPYERETRETNFLPQFVSVTIDAATTKQIEAIVEKYETTISVFLLSCWQVLLWRLTEQSQLTIGTSFDGRNYQGLESALGLFAKYLPVPAVLEAGISFSQLLTLTTEMIDEIREYQEYFTWESNEEKEEEEYFPFCYEYAEEAESYCAGGLSFSIVKECACTERFEVKLSCVRRDAGLRVEFHYDSSCYHEADVQRLGAQYQRLLASVLENEQAPISELEVVSEWERQQQLAKWNETEVAYEAAASIQQLFERQAAERPETVAVVCGDESLSYVQLNQRANQLAHYLRRVGVGPEVRVGLCVERSLAMVVGVLGILKAGGAYVPLDPSYPVARLELMLGDCGATVLLTEEHLVAQLAAAGAQVICFEQQWNEIEQESVANPELTVTEENLAYVIYTSGSTGRPKGVGVTQQNLVHTTRAREVYYRTTPRSFLLLSSIAFDSSVAGLFWTLCGGGRLVMPGEGMQREARELVKLVQEQEVTHVLSLPSLYGLLLEEGEGGELATLAGVIVAGEVCGPWLVQRHGEVAPQAVLYNEYGPTEGSVWSTVQQCDLESKGASVVPIGRPIANVRVYLLDARLRVAPLGVRGELYVGGAGVTRGYLNDAALTALKFVPDPFGGKAGGRLYRTGDEARYRPSGEIEFLGRVDNQVKIRGYRIELDEIEAVLRDHAAVREGVVVATDDQIGGKRLVGYLVLDEQHAFTACRLLRYKREGLLARLGSCELPNGMTIIHHNKNEADYLYREIFEEQAVFAHGIQLQPGACVFDVGANIGLFSLFVRHICEDARIYAFEPIPQIFKILRANSELYGLNARLFECDLCNETQGAVLTDYPHLSLMSGLVANAGEAQSVVKSFEVNKPLMNGGMTSPNDAALDESLHVRLKSEPLECRLRTISEVIAEEGVEQIDLLKVDVETSELNVLLGITHADWAKIRQVVVEVEDREQRLDQITDLLESKGFELAIEQRLALANTGLYKVYAVRPAQKRDAVREMNKKMSQIPKPAWSSPSAVLAEVRDLLKQKLPEHMIPSSLVLLEELPLMPNGKIDRLTLPVPEQIVSEEERSLPRTPVEEMLAGIWSEVLGVKELSVTANFFELGGHSLLATQVMSRVREALQVEMPVRSLFAQPTVRGLAASVEQQLQAEQGLSVAPIRPASRIGELPLSYAQQRLWFADQLTPGSALYNVAAAVRLNGVLNVQALRRTLAEIIRRHEVLRTSFPARQGEPVQVIAANVEFQLPLTDLSELEAAEREQTARRMAEAEAQTPFDLTAGPLVRARLVRLGDTEHVALFTMHHIVSDGWSMGILIQEVSQLYEAYSRGEESPLAELEIQYADYAVWQREWLTGEVLAKQLAYWQEQLAGAPETLALPTDKRRPAVQSFRGGQQRFALPLELSGQLKELSRQESSSLFMTLLAGFQTLLHYYSKQTDIVVGANVANRHHAETEGLIGFFVNTLALRCDLTGDPSFRELLKRVREMCLEAYVRQDLPFEKLVALQSDRDLSRSPLFQVKIEFGNGVMNEFELPGLKLSALGISNEVVRYDLHLFFSEQEQSLKGNMVYDTDLFEPKTIERICEQLETLLHIVVEEPEMKLSVLTEMLAKAEREHQIERERKAKEARLTKYKQVRRQIVEVPILNPADN